MRLINFPYLWMPSTVLDNLSYALWDIRLGLRNLWRWFPVVWQDRNDDYTYIVQVLEFKLRQVEDLERRHGRHTTSQRDAGRIHICAALCRRLAEDEYLMNAFGNPYTRDRYDKGHTHHSDMMAEQDIEYLGLMLRKHLRGWWN
jgi:hypothetical protein